MIIDKYKENIVFNFKPDVGLFSDLINFTTPTVNDTLFWSRNKYGKCLNFPDSGSLNYGDVGSVAGSTGVTIVFKGIIRDTSGNSAIIARADGGTTKGYSLFAVASEIRLRVTTTSTGANSSANLDTSTSANDGLEHIIIATYSDTDDTMRISVDGVQVASSAILASGVMADNATALTVGAAGGSVTDGCMNEIIVLNTGISQTEMAQLYDELSQTKSFSKRQINHYREPDGTVHDVYMDLNGRGFNETLNYVDAGLLSNTDWEVQSGRFDIELQEDSFKKVIKNTLSGIVCRPSSQAYGQWDFTIDKLDANTFFYYFVSDECALGSQNGYMILVDNLERVQFRRIDAGSGAGLFVGDTGVVTTGTHIRIKRSVAGEWSLYTVDAQGNETLLNADTGANPVTDNTYTESKFSILDMDAGDYVYNFRNVPDGF